MITSILLHKVDCQWFDDYTGELQESDIDHIKKLIDEGCWQGELYTWGTDHEEHRGWWKILNEVYSQ